MCIIAIAYRAHPAYPLVIAANRDEFYDRPATPLAWWKDHPGVLAGKDLKSHGTWFGVNKRGKIAALTNYREPGAAFDSGISRGRLVMDYLAGDAPPDAYLENIAEQKDRYNGFNLVAGSSDSLFWYSNRGDVVKKIEPGIHGLSNHLLNTPWPKVVKIREGISRILSQSEDIDPENLFSLLTDSTRPPDEMLPDTGIGLQWEKILSPIFVTSSAYGTRCSSLLLLDAFGKMLFCERTYDGPEQSDTRSFTLYPKNRSGGAERSATS